MSVRRPVNALLATLGLLLATLLGRALEEPPLHRSVIALAPSAPQLQTLPAFPPRWILTADFAGRLDTILANAGFDPELAADLRRRLTLLPGETNGLIVPDRALLARFRLQERADWQMLLSYHHANVTYRWPLSLGPADLRALDAEPRWSEAVARVRAASLPHGDRLIFGDFFALEDAFATPVDRLDFYRVALGSDALLLKLRRQLDHPLDAQAQAVWWQVNGRHRAIEPLLNAIASIPNAPRLDLTYLLPRLPRALLNTYPPNLGEAEDPGVESSLLASEFFSLAPGADHSAPGGLRSWLEQECVPVDGPPQYGDLFVYGDLKRTAWPYTAVYVAGGIGLARRPTAFGPWQFIDLADIGRLNPRLSVRPPRIFRTKRATLAPGEPPFQPGRMPDAWRAQLKLKPLAAGPWGKLWYYDVLLAPSGDMLRRLPAPSQDPVWTFAGLTPAEIRDAILTTDMPAAVRHDLTTLFAAAVPDAEGRITVHPPLELVLAVPREFRTRLFPHLVAGFLVTDYAQHIPFPAGFKIEEWFDAGSLPEPVRQAILRLVYPSGDRVMLSDFGALFSLLGSEREKLTAHRAALREPAVIVLLEKPRPEEVPALADYWQHAARAKNARRLLESFAASGSDLNYLDIVHLLSPLEREFLNTYFEPAEPTLTPSCFWTAFNFGAEKPDPRFLVIPGLWTEHQALAGQELATHYQPIAAPDRLGDIIGYRRKGDAGMLHVCVFVADQIVFTKNGYTFSKPWIFSRLEEVDALYLTSPDIERVIFRRRDAN